MYACGEQVYTYRFLEAQEEKKHAAEMDIPEEGGSF
jgi:hypothetical protein